MVAFEDRFSRGSIEAHRNARRARTPFVTRTIAKSLVSRAPRDRARSRSQSLGRPFDPARRHLLSPQIKNFPAACCRLLVGGRSGGSWRLNEPLHRRELVGQREIDRLGRSAAGARTAVAGDRAPAA